jgi:hypothetical protein
MAKTFYALMIVLCLFSSVLTSVAPQQISFNPEYVSPPPAEISYLSLDAVDKGAYTDFRMSMVAYSLEGGPFIAGLLALYSSSWEACWGEWVNGPGRIDLIVSCSWRTGYRSIGNSLYILRGNSGAWIQTIDINGVDIVCPATAQQPDIKEVTISTHKDNGILVNVFLNAPAVSSNVRVRIYRGSQIVYDFAKTVNIPTIWVYSPCIDLRIDFGPLHLKKAGSYVIQVDALSGGRTLSKSITYEEPGTITVSLDNPYGASWSVSWSGGASGSRSGVGSDSWSIWATSKVDFRADVLSNPLGYTCSIYPSFITVQPGDQVSFRIECTRILEKTTTYIVEKTRTETQTVEYLREYTRTVTAYVTKPVVETVTATVERTVATTVTAQALEANLPIILSIAAIAIAVAVSVTSLIALRKRVGQQ